jgi:hypothetical protein
MADVRITKRATPTACGWRCPLGYDGFWTLPEDR